ncbi:MAG: hypothetical protein Q4E12_00905 [Coriobacteriia bacterium]|nr:hypothetical protein [Coriobacteriia bacterium]
MLGNALSFVMLPVIGLGFLGIVHAQWKRTAAVRYMRGTSLLLESRNRRMRLEEAARNAYVDGLTGLQNRRAH